MALKIERIHIKAFRGIVDSEIPLNGKSLLINGENGTGKSSLVDAIEFFFKRNISTLKGKGVTFQRHGHHTNYSTEDIQVDLTFTNGSTFTRTYKDFSPIPYNFKKYFDLNQEGQFILRRKQLLYFIDSTPSDRFKIISGFMGLNYLEKIEKEIKISSKKLKEAIDVKENGIGHILDNISDIIGKEIKNKNEVLPSLNELFINNGLPELNSFEDATEHSSKMLSIIKENSENLKNIVILKEIQQKTEKRIETNLNEIIKEFNRKINAILTENIKENMSLKRLLESGKEALKIEELDGKCPLCENDFDKKKLLSKIEDRLQTLENTSKRYSVLKKEQDDITDDLSSIIDYFKDILTQIEKIDEFKDDKLILKQKIDYFVLYKKNLESNLDLKEIELEKFNTELNNSQNIIININQKIKILISNIQVTDEEKKFLELVETLAVAVNEIKDITEFSYNLKKLKSQLNIVENIYKSFLDLKKAKIQSIFDSVQSDIQDFYSLLHPKEPHNNIKLNIINRASAELTITSFNRENQDARALTSEGHLDSLGLCIFLALVKKFNHDSPLIVLDDIVTTVDSAHRQMICKLLFTKFKKKQFIITTHENLWYQQLIKSQQVFGVEFENYSITNWTVDEGPDLKPYQENLDRIYEKISAGDLACAGNECRQYLEWVLEEICKSIEAEVMLKERYTVADLMNPVRGQLKEIVADPDIKKQIKEAFKELDNNSIMGNILSHNNLFAGSVSSTEVNRFVESINKLRKLMSCPSCKRFLIYHEKAGILKCPRKCEESVIIAN